MALEYFRAGPKIVARRPRRQHKDASREPGGFAAIPWSVLDSPIFQGLSHPAKALLLEVARQRHGEDDNGRMLLSNNYLRPRGWRSPEVITRAKRELLEAELIFETVKGHRPNKASWYAVTWYALARNAGYDAGVEKAFIRGAYRLKGLRAKNASLSTPPVLGNRPIGTADVSADTRASTADVPIHPLNGTSPSTPAVHPLEVAIFQEKEVQP